VPKDSPVISNLRNLLLLGGLLLSPVIAGAQSVDVDMTGDVLEVYADDFANHRAERFYLLHDQNSGGLYRLRFRDGEHREFRTGDRVRVRGHKHDNEVTLPADGATVQPVEVAAAAVAGEQKTIVIGINFQNANLECSQSQIHGFVFDGAQSVNGLYQETSLGNLWFTGDVVGPFTINYNSSGACDYNAWATAAEAAATAAGVNVSQYTRKVYVFSKVNGCGWAGLGTVGGNPSRAWIATCDLADVYAHELGHNLGMHHASTDADNNDVSDCEYCDNSDVMGYGGVGLRALNAPHREQMGWQTDGKVQSIVSNGVYMVAPLETSSTPYPQTLKIAKPGTSEFYYFSYRRRLGYDVNMPVAYADRTSVHHYQGSGAAQTFLISNLPDSGSFTDPLSGLTVMQLGHNDDFVTLDVSYGCTPAAPSANVSPANQNAVAGTTLSYTMSVVNADSAACGSSTFLLSRSVPAGWTSALLPLSMTLAPGQSSTAQVTLTAPAGAASGVYTATVNVADNFNVVHNVSAGMTCTINPDATPPTAPSNLVATSRRRRVSLAWTRSTDNVGVAFYLVKRDGILIGQTTGATFTDRGVTKGESYSYVVTAKDAAGNESPPSNTATVVAAGRRQPR
jgi:hypothetical protein